MAWKNLDSTYQSFQHTRNAARTKGTPEKIGDTVAFPFANAAAGEQCTMVYKSERVRADKVTGSAIAAGQIVRYVFGGAGAGSVTAAAHGAQNQNCGFAIEAAAAGATEVDIVFDGRLLDQ